jgi:hypothetical protein
LDRSPGRRKLLGFGIALFIVQGLISTWMFPAWKKNYSTGNTGIAQGLSVDQLLASVSGLRQMVAGILWVRSDTYFHEGQFDAILPLIRLITWLDPKQLEVYSTGGWHIAYNFTDEQNRSDRRYIPLALRLLEEGVQQNKETFRLYHESGWLYHHKIDDDYGKAVEWFKQSVSKPDVLPALRNVLVSAYQKNGQLMESLEWLAFLEQDNQKRFEKTQDPGDRQQFDTVGGNLNNLLVRMASRGVFARAANAYGQYPYDTRNPVDLKFSVQIEVLQPKVIRVSGSWGIPTTGARIRCTLRDNDWALEWEPAPGLDFDIDKDRTYMLDSLYTQNGQFDRKIDMSRNPTMYPFKADTYLIEFFYSARNTPAHIQDKIGWDGEGMTDARYYIFDEKRKSNVLYAAFEIPRDMIFKRGNYKFDARIQSPGYKPITTREQSDIMDRVERGSLRN